jgi:hypothetical protein
MSAMLALLGERIYECTSGKDDSLGLEGKIGQLGGARQHLETS